eukprot:UN01396
MLFEIVSAKMSSIVETVVLENFTGKAFIFYGVISTFFYQLELFGICNRMFFFKNSQKSSILDRVNPMIFFKISQKSAILDRVNPMIFLKIRQKSAILDRFNPVIFFKISQKSTIFDRGNPMNFLQNYPKIMYFR